MVGKEIKTENRRKRAAARWLCEMTLGYVLLNKHVDNNHSHYYLWKNLQNFYDL